MERYEVIQTIKKLMMEYNLTPRDLTELTNDDGTYPFEVLYTDGTRSLVPLQNKEIWGVIVGNGAVCLTESAKLLSQEKVSLYCREKTVNGKTCTAGSEEFWNRLTDLGSKFSLLNAFIISLGGEPLEDDYWTETVIETERGQCGRYIGFSSYYDWVFMWTSRRLERLNKARPVCML